MKKAHSDIKKDFKLPEQADASSNKVSFSVPDNYFDQLTLQISSKIEKISALENKIGESPFTVPENYFENLPQQINQQISSSGKRFFWKEWLSVLLRPQVSLAFASLLFLIWFTFKTQEVKTIDIPQSQLSLEDLNDSEYIQYLDEYSIIEVLASQQEVSTSNSNTDAYIQYLIDNNIDISQLDYTL